MGIARHGEAERAGDLPGPGLQLFEDGPALLVPLPDHADLREPFALELQGRRDGRHHRRVPLVHVEPEDQPRRLLREHRHEPGVAGAPVVRPVRAHREQRRRVLDPDVIHRLHPDDVGHVSPSFGR
jgi:hypothetical protein